MKKLILGTLCAFALNAAGMSLASAEDKPADAKAEKAPKKAKKGAKADKKEEGAKADAPAK